MNLEVTLESFRERRTSLIWWSVGIAFFIGLNLAFYPSIKDSSELSDYSRDLPEAMRALFVGGELDLTSPVGFLNSQIFALMAPLFFAAFGISAGAWAVAGVEEQGGLDLLLAQPVTRASIVLQRFFWLAASSLILGLVVLVVVVAGAEFLAMDIGIAKVAAATLSTVMFGVLYGTIALATGCVLPGKSLAVSVAAAAATVAWILDGLSKAVGWLEPFDEVSPYFLAYGDGPLSSAPPVGDWAILALLVAACLTVAVFGLRRRDIQL